MPHDWNTSDIMSISVYFILVPQHWKYIKLGNFTTH